MTTKHIDMGEGKLPIDEFNLDSMVENPSIVMIAKRGSGKSVVCKAILRHFKKIPVGLIIAPTDRKNPFYSKFFSDSYIHYEYKSTIMEKLLERQEAILEKKKVKSSIDPRALLLMDDCLASKGSWAKDPLIAELFYNGRHYQITYILTMQYPLGISPEFRSNFDYIFLLAEDFITNMKRIFEHYAGMFPDFGSFKDTFKNLTANFGCMVICNRGARESFREKIFWYRAPKEIIDCTFEMGCPQFRKFHENNYNEEWNKKKKQFNIEEYCSKRKKDKIALQISKVTKDNKDEKK